MIKKQDWWQLSSVQIGGTICLPVIMIGQTLVSYGFLPAILSIILGNSVLLLLGMVSSKMSFEKKKTTMENAVDYFGEKGSTFFSGIMTLSMLAWFGIQLNMMTQSLLDLFPYFQNALWQLSFNVGLGLMISLATLYGIKGLNFLASFSLPLLMLTLFYALFTREMETSSNIPSVPFSLGGSSLVIAMAIAVVIDMPTFFRHARRASDGYISIFLLFAVAFPLLEIIGVYLAWGSDGKTILDVLKKQDWLVWNIWVAVFLVLAGWTTNNLNLYSGAVCFESLAPKLSEKMRSLIIGFLGTLLACFDLIHHLEMILDFMGILIASMGAVIFTRYILEQYCSCPNSTADHTWHLSACGFGMAVGFLGISGVSLTSISVLDACIGASLGTLLILARKEFYEKTYLRTS